MHKLCSICENTNMQGLVFDLTTELCHFVGFKRQQYGSKWENPET